MPETTLSSEETTMAVDIDDSCCENVLNEALQSHSDLMHDTRGNIQSAHNILRHSGVKKFNVVDPIESAAVEMILKVA